MSWKVGEDVEFLRVTDNQWVSATIKYVGEHTIEFATKTNRYWLRPDSVKIRHKQVLSTTGGQLVPGGTGGGLEIG